MLHIIPLLEISESSERGRIMCLTLGYFLHRAQTKKNETKLAAQPRDIPTSQVEQQPRTCMPPTALFNTHEGLQTG